MNYVRTPNLPDGSVRLCAVSSGQSYIAKALEQRGITVLEVPPHPNLAAPVAAHADMLLHHLGGERVVVARDSDTNFITRLQQFGFLVTLSTQKLTADYPGDIALNSFALNGVLYCNTPYTDALLLIYYQSIERRVQQLRQGYAKCSTCIVDSGSIITADKIIAEAARKNGIDVLHIRPGHISLPGYDYGFIGGCSGLLDRNVLAFTGDLQNHPDGQSIAAFCENRGVEAVSLSHTPLLDVGGILPLAIH